MSIAVILLVAGLVSGLARGGKLENIGKVDFRYSWLVFVGLAIQAGGQLAAEFLVPSLADSTTGLAILAVSYLVLVTFVIFNLRLPGAYLMGAGMLLNILVIGLNGGMPVSLEAVEAAGFDATDYLETAFKHELMGPETKLEFLGDIIPIPLIRTAVSIGDILLGVGIFLLVDRAVRYAPRRAKGRGGA